MTPLAPKFPNLAIQILLFRSKHTVAVVTHAHVLQNFYTTWVRGVACQKQRLGPKLQTFNLATSNLVHNLDLGLAYKKQRFGPKLAGVWDRGASKKIGTPYLFLQPLKLATSDLVHNLGLGLAYQKTTWTKIGGGLGQESI